VNLIKQVQFMTIVGRIGGRKASPGAAAFSNGFGWSKYDFGQDKFLNIAGRRSLIGDHADSMLLGLYEMVSGRRSNTTEDGLASGSEATPAEPAIAAGEEPPVVSLAPEGCDPHFGNVLMASLITTIAVMSMVYCFREFLKVAIQYITKAPEPSADLLFPKWEGPVFLTQYFAVCDAIATSMGSFCDGWVAFASLALIFGPLTFVGVATFLIFIERVRGDLVFTPEEHQTPKEFWQDLKATPGLIAKAKMLKGYYDSTRSAGEWDEDTKAGRSWGWLITDFRGNMWFMFGVLMCKAILINLAIGLTNGKENAGIALTIYITDALVVLTLRPYVDNVANLVEASTGITNALAIFNAALPHITPRSSGKPSLPSFVGDPMTIILTTVGTGICTVKAIVDPFIRIIGISIFVIMKMLDMCGVDREQMLMAAATVGGMATDLAKDKAKEAVTGGDDEEEEEEGDDDDEDVEKDLDKDSQDKDSQEEDEEQGAAGVGTIPPVIMMPSGGGSKRPPSTTSSGNGAAVDRALWRRMSASSLTVVLDIAKDSTDDTSGTGGSNASGSGGLGGALPSQQSRGGTVDSMVILGVPSGAGVGLRPRTGTGPSRIASAPSESTTVFQSEEDSGNQLAGRVPELETPAVPINRTQSEGGALKTDRPLPYNLRDVLSAAGKVGTEIHASVSMVFNPLLSSRRNVRETPRETPRYRDPQIADDLNIAPRAKSPVSYFFDDDADVRDQDRMPSPVGSVGSDAGLTRMSSRLDFDDAGARISQAFVSVDQGDDSSGSGPRVFHFQPPPDFNGPIFGNRKVEPKADLIYKNGEFDDSSSMTNSSFVSRVSSRSPGQSPWAAPAAAAGRPPGFGRSRSNWSAGGGPAGPGFGRSYSN